MNIDKNYNNFIKELKSKIYNTKSNAILSVNRLMIELYFEIGKEILIKQETLGWGKSVVEQMSKDLVTEFGEKSGYSSSNLWRMRNILPPFVKTTFPFFIFNPEKVTLCNFFSPFSDAVKINIHRLLIV